MASRLTRRPCVIPDDHAIVLQNPLHVRPRERQRIRRLVLERRNGHIFQFNNDPMLRHGMRRALRHKVGVVLSRSMATTSSPRVPIVKAPSFGKCGNSDFTYCHAVVIDDGLRFLQGRGQEEKQYQCRGEQERDCTRFRDVPGTDPIQRIVVLRQGHGYFYPLVPNPDRGMNTNSPGTRYQEVFGLVSILPNQNSRCADR
jgi:hypothetical protein